MKVSLSKDQPQIIGEQRCHVMAKFLIRSVTSWVATQDWLRTVAARSGMGLDGVK